MYIENLVKEINTTDKKVIFWGAGRRLRSFIQSFCIDKKILRKPDFITDSTKKIEEDEILGIKTISFDEFKKYNCDEVIIIMTAGLFDLQSQVIKNELYYYPMYHCRSFEVYYYLKENEKKYEEVLNLLADEKSKEVYKGVFETLINGSFWNQSLFETNAYFGNDLIGNLKNDEVFAFAGAFNGKHIDRVLKNNPKVKVEAFEPNKEWYEYLCNKYKGLDNVKIHNNVLWNKEEKLQFDGDMLNQGLDAHICKTVEANKSDVYMSGVKMDDVVKEKVQLIALDVEGSEAKAILGASEIIKRDKPNLAICLYHNIEDFIELPLLLNKLCDNCKFYAKQHSVVSAIETVLYVVHN